MYKLILTFIVIILGLSALAATLNFLSNFWWLLILIPVILLAIKFFNDVFITSDSSQETHSQQNMNHYKEKISQLRKENQDLKNRVAFFENKPGPSQTDISNYKATISQLQKEKQHLEEKIVSLENKNELSQQESLADIIVPIEERRPYDMASYQLERDLNTILGNETDEGGRLLVNTVVAIFKKMGYEAKNIDGIRDNGIDIEIYQKNNQKPYMVIQCKSYTPLRNDRRISKVDVGKFNGFADRYELCRRIFITTSYFDNTAVQEFSDRVILIDRIGLIHLLLKYFPKETVNVLNSLSLPQTWDICKKCGHGKLYPIFYDNNHFSVCTNCPYKYDPKTDKYTKQKYKTTTREF